VCRRSLTRGRATNGSRSNRAPCNVCCPSAEVPAWAKQVDPLRQRTLQNFCR
jgi:hypothetical protein